MLYNYALKHVQLYVPNEKMTTNLFFRVIYKCDNQFIFSSYIQMLYTK